MIIGILLYFSNLNIISSSNFSNHTQVSTILPKNAQSHPKIAIDGNAELDAFPDKIGLGTLADPYIIANYTIDASNIGSGVSIQNIDRYLILQNLTISNSAGYGTGSGIYLKNVSNVQVDSCQTPSNYHGIYLIDSANSSIANNTILDGTFGVRPASSENISLFDNRMTGCGVYLEGDLDSHVSHTSSNNSVNNRSLFWYVNETGLNAANFTSAGQIILVNCTDADISDQNLTAATIGLQLFSTKDSKITNVTANDGDYGFHFDTEALNNTIVNCTTSRNRFYGLFLDSSNTTVIDCLAFENDFHGFLLDFPGEFNNIINSTASNNGDNGIHISNSLYNTITNCTTSGNAQYGLEIFSSEFNTIVNCTLSANTQKGLYLRSSDQNEIINCTISDNSGYGVNLEDSHSNIFSNSISMGNSFYGIYLDNSNSNDILNATINDNINGGLVLFSSTGNEIANCTAWNNPYGYYLYESSYNHISYSTAINNQVHGIYLMDFSQHNTISNCFVDSNTHTGIRLQYASNWNQISNCTSSNSEYGLSIDESYFNEITQNIISDNQYGLYLIVDSYDNIIWENWIMRSTLHQALDNAGTNQWDLSGKGNNWSDYIDRYPLAIDMGGYWNTPYSINGSAGAQDNYPLALNLVLPAPPVLVTPNQTISNSSLMVTWTSVPSVTSYNVYVNGTFNVSTSITQQLIQLHTNGTYEITVTAVNATGESGHSSAISIVAAISPSVTPDPPVLVTPNQTISTSSLMVMWTSVPSVTSYNVYVNGTLNATTSDTQQLIQLRTNGTYEITVTAENVTGESDHSTAISIVVAIPPVLPDPPMLLTSSQTITIGSLMIEWTTVAGATSYNVYVNGTFNVSTSTTQQLIEFRTNGTYEIAVTAVNTTGESEQSAAISIVVAIPPLLPESPTILTSGQTITNSSLVIEWTAVPDATSYNIYVNGTLNATTSNAQQLVQLGLNGTYEITVTAVNASGESDLSSAVVIVVAIPPLLPESPTILTSGQTITDTSLLIEWTAVPDATSYYVYVDGTLNATTSITQQLIYLGTNGMYEITVTAVNASGESDPSGAVVIVVDIPPLLPESPTILTSGQTITNTSLLIEWAAVPGATSYKVYVNGTLNATTSTTQQLIQLGINGVYEITVTAVNDSGESDLSNAIMINVEISPETDPSSTIPSYPIEFILIFAIFTSMKLLSRKRKIGNKQN